MKKKGKWKKKQIKKKSEFKKKKQQQQHSTPRGGSNPYTMSHANIAYQVIKFTIYKVLP